MNSGSSNGFFCSGLVGPGGRKLLFCVFFRKMLFVLMALASIVIFSADDWGVQSPSKRIVFRLITILRR